MVDFTRRQVVQALMGACSIPLVGTLTACSSCSQEESVTLQPSAQEGSENWDNAAPSFGIGVSTSCAPATEIGMQVLRDGGNAVDAAIAVSYALGVCQPYGSGVGGGGSMLVYDTVSQKSTFIDYYDAAPHSFGTLTGLTCVPGFVKGMERARELFGSKDMASLVQPAIDLARNGFEISEKLATMASNFSSAVEGLSCYWNGSDLLGEGDTLVQEDLASTLETIRDGGSAAFYDGDLGEELRQAVGFQKDDFESYVPRVADAAIGECLGCTVLSAPSPFSGITLIEMLKMLELANAPTAEEDTPGYLAALSEASVAATAVRAHYIADPSYEEVDEALLLSDAFVSKALDSQGVEYSQDLEDFEGESTTAFTVIDRNGLIVSVTNTLGNFYGSGQVLHGFHLNSHMTSFSESGANAYAPGKRPRSHTSPSVVVGPSFAFGIGTPGGRRIPKILASVLYDILQGGEDVQRAVDKNRALFEEGSLYVEKLDGHDDLIDVDQTSAYSVIRKGKGDLFGAVQILGCLSDGGLFGATDDRRDGSFEVED